MKNEVYEELKRCLAAERLVALATVVAGPGLGRQLLLWPDGSRRGGLGDPRLDDEVGSRAGVLLSSFAAERRRSPSVGDTRLVAAGRGRGGGGRGIRKSLFVLSPDVGTWVAVYRSIHKPSLVTASGVSSCDGKAHRREARRA